MASSCRFDAFPPKFPTTVSAPTRSFPSGSAEDIIDAAGVVDLAHQRVGGRLDSQGRRRSPDSGRRSATRLPDRSSRRSAAGHGVLAHADGVLALYRQTLIARASGRRGIR